MKINRDSSNLVKMIVLSLMAAVSLVLFFISFPLPLLPPYLKVDFSDVPALIAALIFSPLAGILVLFLKGILYFVASGATDPIGIAANFIAGTTFITPIAYLYHKHKTLKSVVVGLSIGVVGMAVLMSILNYIVILPAYSWLIDMEMNTQIKRVTVFGGILPFNFLKGLIVAGLFIPLFIKLRVWIEGKQKSLAN